MDLTSAPGLLALGAAAVFAYVASSIIAWWRLRHFNGPFVASFSYLWLIRVCRSGRMAALFADVSDRYGQGTPSTVRIGPNELLTSDLDLIRRTSAARSKYRRSSWYTSARFDTNHDSMFSTLDTAAHDKVKAQTAPGYAGKDNPGLEGEMDSIVAQVVEKIRTKYGAKRAGGETTTGRLLDLATMVQFFTLDSISKIAFGQEFGLVREERDIYSHIQMLYEVAPSITVFGSVPYLRAVVYSWLVLRLLGPKPEDKRGVGRILRTAREATAKRFGPGAKDQNDMLGSFIRHGLTQVECQSEAIIQIIAGSDTTATAIRTTMLYLMATPHAYRALQAEIDEGIKAGKISSPVTNAEANELPYLQAAVMEALRLHPPFTGLPFKIVPPGGDATEKDDGARHIPAGTLVSPNFWATGRHPGVFGPDVDVFRPERWTEAGKDERAEMRRVAELVFGYGRWGCAGKMIALMELNKLLVELLRRFDFQLAYPSHPWDSVNYNLFLQRNMWVAVSLRDDRGAE